MPALLEVTNLKKSFQGVHALKGVSFDLKPGEILGLIGPNGSGKSTFVNTVAGVHGAPDGGRVVLDGVEVTSLPTSVMARARRRADVSIIATVPQFDGAGKRHRRGLAAHVEDDGSRSPGTRVHCARRTFRLHRYQERQPAGRTAQAARFVPCAGVAAESDHARRVSRRAEPARNGAGARSRAADQRKPESPWSSLNTSCAPSFPCAIALSC